MTAIEPPHTPTDADLRALQELPADRWFTGVLAPTARPMFRCQRLERAGLLESRVVVLSPIPGSDRVETGTEFCRLPAAH